MTRTLIYQYWRGERRPYTVVSEELFRTYAEQVGAEFRFDPNPSFFRGKMALFYHSLRPIFDPEFHKYDRVLYVDGDVYPVPGLDRNIFDEPCEGIAMAREPHQPALREGSSHRINGDADKLWAKKMKWRYGIDVPRDAKGRVIVFNAGVLLFSKKGMIDGKATFANPYLYELFIRLTRLSRFYSYDQNYLHAMLHLGTVKFNELDTVWNKQVHGIRRGGGEVTELYDPRTADTCFVHLQDSIRGQLDRDGLISYISQFPEHPSIIE